jgi:hypothetical protein
MALSIDYIQLCALSLSLFGVLSHFPHVYRFIGSILCSFLMLNALVKEVKEKEWQLFA